MLEVPGFEYNSDGFVRAMSCVQASLDAPKGRQKKRGWVFSGWRTQKKPLVLLYIVYI